MHRTRRKRSGSILGVSGAGSVILVVRPMERTPSMLRTRHPESRMIMAANATARFCHALPAIAAIAVALLTLTGCSSGSWDDDRKNWSRAFGGQKRPPEVKIIHSRYWKSPHFTYEAEYFFEFTAPAKFLEDWIASQKLILTVPTKQNTPPYFNKPDWFTPKPVDDYDMWMPSDSPHDKFRIYRDKKTGTLYVTDCST
jgi:hypothetical protein